MSNRYFEDNSPLQMGKLARADAINNKVNAIQSAFDQVQSDMDHRLAVANPTGKNLTLADVTTVNTLLGFDESDNLVAYSLSFLTDAVDNASQSASNAANSENLAGQHKTNAQQAQTASEQARDSAQASETKALKWAEELEDTEVETGKFSSKHHALKSEQSATASEQSRQASDSSKSAAQTSEAKAQKWAEEAEDIQVDPGEYSAKHHAIKALASENQSNQNKLDAQTAKGQSESARDTAIQKASDANASELAADSHRLASESSRLASESASDSAIAARDKSQKWAEELEDTEVEAGKYSSLHWAMKAQQWAQTVSNSLVFRGGWDASGGNAPTPSMAPETADYYKITVSGTINSIEYSVGDNIIWDTVNDVWFKVDNTDAVLTVNGKKGTVVLTDLDILGFLASQILRNDQSGSIAGTLTSTGHLVSGSGSGGVAMTINDGYGNANVTWNHKEGKPEQNGNAARIEVNTDSSSGAYMSFELKSGVTESQPVSLTTAMTLYEDRLDAVKFQEGGTDLSAKYLGISAKAADADKLDGINSSSFLRSDASDVKTAGTLRFNDNVYLTIGSGNDVEHFWNGSNYYTDINGGANWYLRDGNSSNATRFTFDIDTGNLTATGNIYEGGTALSSKYLGLSAKAADSNLLDGLDSSAFIRANANDNVSGHTEWQDNYHVRLGTGADFRMYHNGSHNYFDMYTGNLYIRDSTTNRFTFDDAGHFTATGNITAYSDIRVKTDIQTITDALAKVSLLNGVTFLRTDTDKLDRQTGLIAQHVKQVLPEAVQELENGDLTVAYGNMVGLLVESIKELNAKLELLKQETESLRLERAA